MMGSRLSSSGQSISAQGRKRRDAMTGSYRSQGPTQDPAVKIPHLSSENSAQNAWNWNYNNQAWNNNNKNNNNSFVAVRDSLGQYDGAVTLSDLYTAYLDCRRRKKNKAGAKAFDAYAIHILCNLRDEINHRKYRLKNSQCFIVKYPVPREVFCAAFRDRVVQHFVYNELNPVIEKMLIRDTASCRLGKGTDYAIKRAQTFLRRETDDYKRIDGVYFGKFDLSGFFMGIDRHILLDKILWIVDNKYYGYYKSVLHYLLPIIILSDVTVGAVRISSHKDWDLLPPRKTLFGNDHGLPIGNITSQLFANFYLNDIDHLIKSRHKSYVRYVDDMIVIDRDKGRIEETRRIVSEKLKEINMKLNPRKSIISEVRYGFDFLGIRIKPYYSVLGKKRIGRLWYTTSLLKTVEDAYRSCASRRGMIRRYHGKRLSERWYRSLPAEWREHLKMDSSARFHLVGEKALPDKNQLRNICLYLNREGVEKCMKFMTRMAN